MAGVKALREGLSKVSTETWVLAALCTADLVSTVYFLATGTATEANPVLAPTLRFGLWGFAAFKLCTYLIPLAIVERLRSVSPRFILKMLRVGIAGYVAVYALGSLHVAGVIRQ